MDRWWMVGVWWWWWVVQHIITHIAFIRLLKITRNSYDYSSTCKDPDWETWRIRGQGYLRPAYGQLQRPLHMLRPSVDSKNHKQRLIKAKAGKVLQGQNLHYDVFLRVWRSKMSYNLISSVRTARWKHLVVFLSSELYERQADYPEIRKLISNLFFVFSVATLWW